MFHNFQIKMFLFISPQESDPTTGRKKLSQKLVSLTSRSSPYQECPQEGKDGDLLPEHNLPQWKI